MVRGLGAKLPAADFHFWGLRPSPAARGMWWIYRGDQEDREGGREGRLSPPWGLKGCHCPGLFTTDREQVEGNTPRQHCSTHVCEHTQAHRRTLSHTASEHTGASAAFTERSLSCP